MQRAPFAVDATHCAGAGSGPASGSSRRRFPPFRPRGGFEGFSERRDSGASLGYSESALGNEVRGRCVSAKLAKSPGGGLSAQRLTRPPSAVAGPACRAQVRRIVGAAGGERFDVVDLRRLSQAAREPELAPPAIAPQHELPHGLEGIAAGTRAKGMPPTARCGRWPTADHAGMQLHQRPGRDRRQARWLPIQKARRSQRTQPLGSQRITSMRGPSRARRTGSRAALPRRRPRRLAQHHGRRPPRARSRRPRPRSAVHHAPSQQVTPLP